MDIKKDHSAIVKLIVFLFMLFCMVNLSGCSDNDNVATENTTPNYKEDEVQTTSEIQPPEDKKVDFSDCFEGLNGCAVIYSSQDNKYYFYNDSMCKEQVSPLSTFKIISSLMGLSNGVLKDEYSTMNYNGTEYPISDWNSNLTLQEAFQSSCVWYFRQVIDAVGEDEAKRELKSLQYGNCDVSEWNGNNENSLQDLNGFWLNSSLKISPLEQVQVLKTIFEGNSIYNDNSINTLKSIMVVDDNSGRTIYGKTGSSSDGKAWFVGFVETNEQYIYIAVYIDDTEHTNQVSGNKAKEITLDIANAF